MEFNEVIDKRRTSREWTDREVDFEGDQKNPRGRNEGSSWDHHRSWQFIVLHEREDKERAFTYARRLPSVMWTATAPMCIRIWRRRCMPTPCHGIYTMLVGCPYVIVPLFKCSRLNAEWVSKLNPLTTAWCVAENIMLAVINEGLGYSCASR